MEVIDEKETVVIPVQLENALLPMVETLLAVTDVNDLHSLNAEFPMDVADVIVRLDSALSLRHR